MVQGALSEALESLEDVTLRHLSFVGLCLLLGLSFCQIPENERCVHVWGCAVVCIMPAAIGSDKGDSLGPGAGLACQREWASSLALREVTKKSCVFFHKAKSIHEFGFLK